MCHAEAGDLPHHDVEQDEVVVGEGEVEGFFGGVGYVDGVAFELEVELEDFAKVFFVVDNKDVHSDGV